MTKALHPLHPFSDASLNRMRMRGDWLADAVALRLDFQAPELLLNETLFLAKSEIGLYQEFVDQMNSVPDWVQPEWVERGRRVQLAFAHLRQMAWQIGGIVESLATHPKLSNLEVRQEAAVRLAFSVRLNQGLREEKTLLPGGALHRLLMRERLQRAMSRRMCKERRWHTLTQGEPFNQEQMLLSVIENSYLTLRCMRALGADLCQDDRDAVHHFWRYAGYLMGIDSVRLPHSLNEEQALLARIHIRRESLSIPAPHHLNAILDVLSIQSPLAVTPKLMAELCRRCLEWPMSTTRNRTPQWARAVNLYITAIRGATYAHYHLPGMGHLSEQINDRLLRNWTRGLNLHLPPHAALRQTA